MATSTVLIDYPPEFLCYSKFKRKLKSILGSLGDLQLVCINDPNSFAKKYTEEESLAAAQIVLTFEASQPIEATHAIFFENSREQEKEVAKQVALQGTPVRRIKLVLTKVVNIDKGEPYDIYIGRGSGWGNPYAIGFDGDRNEVLQKFQYDFECGFLPGDRANKVKISKVLTGKRLGCHCKPNPCHGDIFAEYLNSLDDDL